MRVIQNWTAPFPTLTHFYERNPYDFNAQLIQATNFTLYPGDRIRLTCIWNTMAETAPVQFGSDTAKEMCAHSSSKP
jgi:Copper type II ascorbate-dependent monooxygenase, C-terminal domain